MADLAWFSGLFLLSPGILIQPPFLARKNKHLGTFSVHVRLMVLELASLEKKKKENDDFRFFQNSFSWLQNPPEYKYVLCYKAELESEDIFVLRRVLKPRKRILKKRFVDLGVSYDVLSPSR